MTPPTQRVTATVVPPSPSRLELQDILNPSNLFLDLSNRDHPNHWAEAWQSDQSFRTSHPNLFLAIEALREFFSQSSLSLTEEQRDALSAWSSEATHDEIETLALNHLRVFLRDFSGTNSERAASVLETIGAGEAPETTVQESTTSEANSEFFRVQSISVESHFLDSDFRPLPSYLTLGTLPREGLGQTFSSTAVVRAGFEARLGQLGIFAQIYGGDGRPDGNPSATFGQFGVILGLQEYNRGLRITPVDGFYVSILGGMSRVGLGLGDAWCSRIDGSEISGASCRGENTFQLSAINESDILSVGVGPVELGLRLFPNTVSWNPGTNALPESDRDPFSLRLTYFLDPPQGTSATQDPDSVFWQRVSDSEVAFAGASLFSNFIQINARHRTEAAYERARVQFALPSSDGSTYATLNLGTVFGGVMNGLSEGGMAYRLGRDLHMGYTAQQAVLGVLMGIDSLIPLIGTLATPGEPSEADYHSGDTRGITDLQAQAYRLSLPTSLTRNAMAVLEALGAFGDRDRAVREDGIQYFHVAHGVLGLAGLALILTSGDLSGNGFLGWSVLGNQLPNTSAIEIVGSRFSVESQRLQDYRVEAGAMLLSLAVQGVLDVVLSRSRYLELREATARAPRGEAGEEAPSSETTRATSSGNPISANLETDGHSRAMVTMGGSF